MGLLVLQVLERHYRRLFRRFGDSTMNDSVCDPSTFQPASHATGDCDVLSVMLHDL